jgi:hypothetical protein
VGVEREQEQENERVQGQEHEMLEVHFVAKHPSRTLVRVVVQNKVEHAAECYGGDNLVEYCGTVDNLVARCGVLHFVAGRGALRLVVGCALYFVGCGVAYFVVGCRVKVEKLVRRGRVEDCL